MMSSRLNRRRETREPLRPRQLALVIGLVFILVFGGNFISKRLGGPATMVSRPVWLMRDLSASVWQKVDSLFSNKSQLLAENQELKRELANAQAQILDKQNLTTENKSLREALGQRSSGNPSLLTARLLMGWQTGPFDVFNLDLGRDNSTRLIEIGDPVLLAGNIWLGQVVGVFSRTSKIKLLSLPGEMTPVVLGPDRIPVTLKGRGGGNFITTLPRGVKVSKGDLAFASGPDRDWLVAVVGSVQLDSTGATQKIFLTQPVKVSNLKYVELGSN